MSEPLTVYVVETGDYEQRGVFLVATSIDAAVQSIKAAYAAPFRVTWDSPTVPDTMGCARLCGHFADVPGYSIAHEAIYDMTPYEVTGCSP